MTAYSSNVTTGNWNTSGSWTPSGVPGSADTVTILNGHTITLDADITVGATVVEGRLTMGTGRTLTMNAGTLTIGNGTSKDGQLDFGAGATLALGSNNLILGNCILRSNATTSSWATVTGSGNIQTHGTVTGPKQDIVLTYVSFQNTGSILFAHKPTGTGGAGVTNQIDIQHCTFVGTGTITSGLAATGATDMLRRWKYNDFRNIGLFTITGLAGTSSLESSISYNTFNNSTVNGLKINNLSGFTISNNVFDNYNIGYPSSGSSGAHTITQNFFTYPTSASGGSGYIQLSCSYAASTISKNYIYNDFYNPHMITFGSGSGGTGTFSVTENVTESTQTAAEGDFINPGVLGISATKNLQIGPATIVATANSYVGAGITMSQNTIYLTYNDGDTWGHTWLLESSATYTGDVKLSSNLMAYKSGVSQGASAYFATNNTSIIPQTLYFGDYNAYPSGLTANYRQFTVTNTGHDINISDPQFVDPSRNLQTWGQTVLGTGGTVQQAKDKFLAINGYNSTSKTQSDIPSGATIYGSTNSLVNWVQAGYVPKAQALKTAGEGGIWIGAFDVQASSSTPTDIMKDVFQLIWN